MLFRTSNEIQLRNKNQVYLVLDNWNDFGYKTLFGVFYIDDNEKRRHIGSVKIAQKGMDLEGLNKPNIPLEFNTLGDDFFSVGQDVSYYRNLYKLGSEKRILILEALNDFAFDEKIFESVRNLYITETSLLRSVSASSVEGEFRRLSHGKSKLTSFDFKFISPKIENIPSTSMELSFAVRPLSNPPTNIHVLIGRNGVGKILLLDNMTKSLVYEDDKFGHWEFVEDEFDTLFANLITVSFSAFDSKKPPKERDNNKEGINYSYIGLKSTENKSGQKSHEELKYEFISSLVTCRAIGKITIWKSVLAQLESDYIFSHSGIVDIIENESDEDLAKEAQIIFKKLSSGHQIVLLTISRLVERIAERSLVLIDEPETHLHPPLLSAFIRALSSLLIQRNGVAIIATHSPVVLQEVPNSCVWKLQRKGANAKAERLEIESFGENVGTLTREVFGLEVENSGFHKLLAEAVEKSNSYDEVLSTFNNELGFEARAILRVLFHEKNS